MIKGTWVYNLCLSSINLTADLQSNFDFILYSLTTPDRKKNQPLSSYFNAEQ